MNRQEINNIILITIGSAFLSCGVAFFLYPAKILTGGTPGIGLIAHYLTNISIGKAMLAVNVPLLLLGKRHLSLGFTIRTIYSMVVTSILIDLLVYYVDFPVIKSLLLSTLYGGVTVGVGIGLILKSNASAGGTTIIARIIASKTHFKPASVIMVLDAIIVISVGIIFKNFEAVLWSIISIYSASIVINKIVTGGLSDKLVNIVSEKTEEICAAIMTEIDRDGSVLEGQNLAKNHTKSIIFVVVDIKRIIQLRQLAVSYTHLTLPTICSV